MMIWLCLSFAVVVTVTFSLQLLVSLNRYRLKPQSPFSRQDLPTISVCIPARNETHALADCLQSVLASDYEKLEVIVYDDCSQDKTSSIIRSFAHDGVRFIQGDIPAEGWLGKNYACEMLAKHASGKYILYMGVDTRIEPTTITELMNYVLYKRASMVSVLPRRRDTGWRASVFLAPLRYCIQMVVPQRWHTPAASALWVVRRDKLQEIGGFEKIRNHIMPESTFARLFDQHGTYRYIVGTDGLGVFYAKKWRSQAETSIRLSYPTLKKQPLLVLLVIAMMYIVFVVPYIVVASSLATLQWEAVSMVASGLVIVYALLYSLYTRRAWRHGWLLGALAFPYVILQEMALILASMIAYMLGKVDWKGRNICYPVLRRHSETK